MVVRLVAAARIGGRIRTAGELWDLPFDEAARLIEDGDAVPASSDEQATETR